MRAANQSSAATPPREATNQEDAKKRFDVEGAARLVQKRDGLPEVCLNEFVVEGKLKKTKSYKLFLVSLKDAQNRSENFVMKVMRKDYIVKNK